MTEKRIFAFWEPKENIPPYLQLCMKTWKKFLPEYEIVILDYSNLENWLGKDFYPNTLYEHFSLPIQADAIRCAILNKYGGIWLDVDTIITSSNVKELFNIDSQFILIQKHIGFIVAKKNANILEYWQKNIYKNLKLAQLFYNANTPQWIKFFLKKFFSRKFLTWDCLGNGIINKKLRTKNKKVFYKIKRDEIYALPEVIYKKKHNLQNSLSENYIDFYFNANHADEILPQNKGIICLHNSWTPQEYKQMSKEEFLQCSNTLTNIYIYWAKIVNSMPYMLNLFLHKSR